MSMRSFGLAIMCTLLLGSLTALASQDYVIPLVTGTLTPGETAEKMADLSAKARQSGSAHCIIQLYGDPTDSQRRALERAGLTLLEPLPGNAWVAALTKSMTSAKARDLGIRWAGEITPDLKQHPRIQRGEFGPWSQYEGGKVIIAMTLYADVASATGEAIAYVNGGVPGDYIESIHTWVIAVDPAMIAVVAADEDVEFVDVLPPPMTPVNDVARQVVGANTVQAPPYNLNGAGVTVCVYDAGLVDGSHTDFGGRVTAGEGGSILDHSTHVAGSVGGSGALSAGQYRGMAPGCSIVSYLYEACNPYCLYDSPQDIEANYRSSRNTYGADLCTNSIGSNIAANGYSCAWEGDYETVSQLLDNIVRGSLGSPFIVLYAAGNERGYGTCGTTYSTMGVPACAKNIITVGATNDTDGMSTFSSWGPTDDGRVKPEVCAPGVNIHSTMPGNTYGDMSGTSMATPITAGCVTLVLEQFNRTYPGLIPLPSTIKALFINTAVDLGNTGVDYQYGFGRIAVQAAVDATINGNFLEGQLTTGQVNTHTFNVPAGTTSLRVSLSWMDPAAARLANPTLINDLDVTLTSPTATVYYPMVLNPASPGNVATTGVNHRDNSEQVVVASPVAGQWTITVSATSLPTSPQTYSLAASQSILTGYGHVNGTVTDANTLLPISGVLVRNLSGFQSDVTGADGYYELFLPASTVTLEYSGFGYITSTEEVVVPNGGTVTVNKTLTPPEFTLDSPSLSPTFGTPTTSFTYSVNYTSAYNHAPVSALVYVDTVPHTMTTADPTYTDGSLFTFVSTLPEGVHNYYFQFVGSEITVRLPDTSAYAGPVVGSIITCYDFESDQGWTVGAPGDNATTGIWGRMDPEPTYEGTQIVQPADDHTPDPGVICYVTDGRAGSAPGDYDVDGGQTTLLSPIWDLSTYPQAYLDLWTWYTNRQGNNPSTDTFRVDISSNGGTSWVSLIRTMSSWEYWKNDMFALQDFITLSNQVQLRVVAADRSPGSLVESAVDDVCLYGVNPQPPEAPTELVIAVEDMDLHLYWEPSDGATAYRIERATIFEGPYTEVITVGAGTTDWVDVNGAASDLWAFYHVIAIR
jgi:hypothetical protein